MSGRIPARIARLCAALLAVFAVGAVAAGAASAETVYDNIPATLPGNFASIGLAATSTTEFGGEIELAGTARSEPTVTVVMSSWSCETGNWYEGNCLTPKPNKTFKVPLTVRIYQADELAEGPVAEVTKNIKMHYRPSESSKCSAGHWYDETSATCFHGYAFPVSVTLKKLKKIQRSDRHLSYPHSSGAAESLNVSVSEPEENTLSIGKDPVGEESVAQLDLERSQIAPAPRTWARSAAEEGATGCQEGINYQPVISVSANA